MKIQPKLKKAVCINISFVDYLYFYIFEIAQLKTLYISLSKDGRLQTRFQK